MIVTLFIGYSNKAFELRYLQAIPQVEDGAILVDSNGFDVPAKAIVAWGEKGIDWQLENGELFGY